MLSSLAQFFVTHVPFFPESWSFSSMWDSLSGEDIMQRWTKHISHGCDGQHLERKAMSYGNITRRCWWRCYSSENCQHFIVVGNAECTLYATCILVPLDNGVTYSKPYAETSQGFEGTTLAAEETAEGPGGTTRVAEETSESGGAKPVVDRTTEGSAGITLSAEETPGRSDGTTLASKGTTERSEGTTLTAVETTEGSEGTKLEVEGADEPRGTTLAPGGTTEGPRRQTPTTEGAIEVLVADKTITEIKTATEALLKSTLETEQTTIGIKETTEPTETPSDYENAVNPFSPQVTKIPRIVTTSAFTEGNSGEKTRRWPKDVPLIKQITGNCNLCKYRHI